MTQGAPGLDEPDHRTRKMESRIDGLLSRRRHTRLEDGFKGDKVVNEVLDRPAVMTIYNMIKSGVISGVVGALRAGKESVVFRAVDSSGKDVALKVYLVTTSSFKRRAQYIEGDPRFSRIRGGTRNMVKMWARKEHANLRLCHARGLPVPMPLYVSDNVLAMEFVGDGGMPAHTLLESETDTADHDEIMDIVRRMYKEAGLVHGDLSPYNIFKTESGLVVFDMGSAVDKRHPNSIPFLKRDINNMSRFFVRRGLTVENPSDILGWVTG